MEPLEVGGIYKDFRGEIVQLEGKQNFSKLVFFHLSPKGENTVFSILFFPAFQPFRSNFHSFPWHQTYHPLRAEALKFITFLFIGKSHNWFTVNFYCYNLYSVQPLPLQLVLWAGYTELQLIPITRSTVINLYQALLILKHIYTCTSCTSPLVLKNF